MSLLRTFSRVLPPPQLMRLPGVGVDISDTSVKYIVFDSAHLEAGKLRLNHWGSIDLPEGTMVEGEVSDKVALAKVLAEVKRRTGIPYVYLSLPDEHAYLFELDIEKNTPVSEIPSVIEFKLEENVPLSSREAYFDHSIYSMDEASGMYKVAVTAYNKLIIDTYLEVCKLAEVTPLVFEVEPAAIARAAFPIEDMSTKLVVDFGQTRTGLGIVYQGELMYTSTIDIGGNKLSASLRKALGDKPESELTQIKNTKGLMRGGEDTTVYDSLIATISALRDEIALRVRYWNDKAGDDSDRYIEQIVLCGGSANLRGLHSYLSESLGIETVLANVWQNAFDLNKVVPPIDKNHSFGFATAIGLGLIPYSDHD